MAIIYHFSSYNKTALNATLQKKVGRFMYILTQKPLENHIFYRIYFDSISKALNYIISKYANDALYPINNSALAASNITANILSGEDEPVLFLGTNKLYPDENFLADSFKESNLYISFVKFSIGLCSTPINPQILEELLHMHLSILIQYSNNAYLNSQGNDPCLTQEHIFESTFYTTSFGFLHNGAIQIYTSKKTGQKFFRIRPLCTNYLCQPSTQSTPHHMEKRTKKDSYTLSHADHIDISCHLHTIPTHLKNKAIYHKKHSKTSNRSWKHQSKARKSWQKNATSKGNSLTPRDILKKQSDADEEFYAKFVVPQTDQQHIPDKTKKAVLESVNKEAFIQDWLPGDDSGKSVDFH